MKKLVGVFALAVMLAGCMAGGERAKVAALYEKYDAHCREHAQEIVGEQDEQLRYQECLDYFITTDVECPHCVVDKHFAK